MEDLTQTLRYLSVLGDRRRMAAWSQVLAREVRPDDVVLEIGPGAGVLSCLAVQLGARAYVIDPTPLVEFGRDLARCNRLLGRVRFFQDPVAAVDLPEPATLLLADGHGTLPWEEGALEALRVARTRHLAPGARVLPRSDRLVAALTDTPTGAQELAGALAETVPSLDVSCLHELAANVPWGLSSPPRVVSDATCACTLDYSHLETPHVETEFSLRAHGQQRVSGVALWIERDLADDVALAVDDGTVASMRPRVLPMAPVELAEDDSVDVALSVRRVGSGFVWRWRCTVRRADGTREAGEERSTFYALPVSTELLRRASADYAPRLHRSGEAVRLTLNEMDGEHTLSEISETIQTTVPQLFAGDSDALTFVSEVARDLAT